MRNLDAAVELLDAAVDTMQDERRHKRLERAAHRLVVKRERLQEKQCRRAKPSGIFFDWLPPFQ